MTVKQHEIQIPQPIWTQMLIKNIVHILTKLHKWHNPSTLQCKIKQHVSKLMLKSVGQVLLQKNSTAHMQNWKHPDPLYKCLSLKVTHKLAPLHKFNLLWLLPQQVPLHSHTHVRRLLTFPPPTSAHFLLSPSSFSLYICLSSAISLSWRSS